MNRALEEIIAAAIEAERDRDPARIERLWDTTPPGQRAALGRHVLRIMGRRYLRYLDPLNRFLAFIEACAAGSPLPSRSKPA